MWTWVLLVTFASGDEIPLGFNAREVCEQVRLEYLARPDVIRVSECRAL